MTARLVDRLRGHAVVGALSSLAVKVGGSASALAMFALASWTLDAAAFGELVIVFNAVSLVAVAAVLGQDTLIQRSWGEYVETDPSLARGAVVFGTIVTALGASLAALLFVLWAILAHGALGVVEIVAVGAFLITQTLLQFVANLARVVRGAMWSEPPRELWWRLPLVAVLGGTAAFGDRASITVFFAVAAIAQGLALLGLARTVAVAMPVAVREAPATFLLGDWARRGATMALAAVAEAGHQYADVILIGRLLGPSAAAGYFVVLRLANVFTMLTSGIHTYSASKIARLHYVGRIADLRRLMSQIMLAVAVLVVLLVAVVVFEGPLLLSLFGSGYRALHLELLAMSLITGSATLAGPGFLLMLTMGADLLYLQLVVAALAVRVAGLAILAPLFGLDGAIAAVALAVVPLSCIVAVVCVRRLGVDPSIVGALRWGLARLRPAQGEIAR